MSTHRRLSPLTETGIVASRIALVFVLLGIGALLRRRAVLTDTTVQQLSRLVVDVAFPALVFVELIHTVTMETLTTDAFSVGFGAFIVSLGLGIGALLVGRVEPDRTRRTFVFLVAMPNWIFLPLLIAEALYQEAGVRAVLLMNVGSLVVLWTLGVGLLRGGSDTGAEGTNPLRTLLLNPGLVATAAGLACALLLPDLRGLIGAPLTTTGGWSAVPATLLSALKLFGSITVPLALLVTGAQLGALRWAQLRPSGRMAYVSVLRLVVVPVAAWGLLVAAEMAGLAVGQVPRTVGLIVAAMPVAISASLFAQRFGGDVEFAAPTIFWSTLASMATVPLVFEFVA